VEYGMKIVLAEDDPLIGDVFEEILTTMGHSIIRVLDGVEALEVSYKHDFDLLLTDLDMPRMNGYDLIKEIRLKKPHLPIIIITGNPPVGGMSAFKQNRITLLVKPVRIAQLQEALLKIPHHA
jgi:CheY-like chemotaxis protein